MANDNANFNVTSIVGKTVMAVKLHDENDYWGDDGFTILFTDGTTLNVGASYDCGFPMVSTAIVDIPGNENKSICQRSL